MLDHEAPLAVRRTWSARNAPIAACRHRVPSPTAAGSTRGCPTTDCDRRSRRGARRPRRWLPGPPDRVAHAPARCRAAAVSRPSGTDDRSSPDRGRPGGATRVLADGADDHPGRVGVGVARHRGSVLPPSRDPHTPTSNSEANERSFDIAFANALARDRRGRQRCRCPARTSTRRCATVTAATTASSAPGPRARRSPCWSSSPPRTTTSRSVLAGQWLDGMTGSDLLDDARRLHPQAKRGLLIDWGDWGVPATGNAIFEVDLQRPDRPLPAPAVAAARRALPPRDLGMAARVGRVAARVAVHDPHRRRVVVGPGVRAAGAARALRDAARVLTRGLGRRARPRRAGRRRGWAPARHLPRRDGPARSHQRRDRGGGGLAGQPARAPTSTS